MPCVFATIRKPKYMHQQMDKRGLVAWAEIPFVNVYVNNPAYDENLRLQLKELILQNYNHPAFCSGAVQ